LITPRLTQRASAGAFVLAAALGLSTASVLPAQSAVVAAAPVVTTTTVSVQDAALTFGESTTVTVSVDAATNGSKPVGKVELRVGDKVLVADVTNSGKVDFDLPVVGASTTPYAAVATFVPTDAAAFSTSTSAPANVTVAKDATKSAVTARKNAAKLKIVAKNVVTSVHGQVPAGKVRFVLKRSGVKVAAVVVNLNSRGSARTAFTNFGSVGTYKVFAKYRGSDNFLPSKGAFSIPNL